MNASAVPPAKPAKTLPLYKRRTLRAFPFMTVLPNETCPSPPTTTWPLRRTLTIVVILLILLLRKVTRYMAIDSTKFKGKFFFDALLDNQFKKM